MGHEVTTHIPYGDLILRQKIVAVVFITLIILLTIDFIRRRTLKERYAILWLVAGVVLIPLVLWPDFLLRVSGVLGIAYPPFTILLTGTVFVVVIIFHFSVALSKSRRHEAKLLMRLVEQEERLREMSEAMAEWKRAGSGEAKGPEANEHIGDS
jgi:hypothetical protein